MARAIIAAHDDLGVVLNTSRLPLLTFCASLSLSLSSISPKPRQHKWRSGSRSSRRFHAARGIAVAPSGISGTSPSPQVRIHAQEDEERQRVSERGWEAGRGNHGSRDRASVCGGGGGRRRARAVGVCLSRLGAALQCSADPRPSSSSLSLAREPAAPAHSIRCSLTDLDSRGLYCTSSPLCAKSDRYKCFSVTKHSLRYKFWK